MKFSWLIFSFLLIGLHAPHALQAQSVDSIAPQQIKGVEVTAKKRPATTRAITPLQYLSAEDIRQTGVQSLSDAVRRFSGVSVKDYGGIGGLKTVSIRGFGAMHTAVTYDGVAISDAQSGQIDIGKFSLDNVSMITMTIGQEDDIFQSARSFASVGVLNITTQTPMFNGLPITGNVQVRGGSFGQVNPSFYLAHRLSNKWAWSANGDWQRADGNYPFKFDNGAEIEHRKRYNSDVNIWRGEVNLYGSFGKGGNLTLKGNYFDSKRGLPGSTVSHSTVANDRLEDQDYYIQANYINHFGKQLSLKSSAKFMRTRNYYKEYKGNEGFKDNIYTQKEYYGSAVLLYQPLSNLTFSLAEDFSQNNLIINYSNQDPKRTTSLTAFQAKYTLPFITINGGLLGTYAYEWVQEGDKPEDRKRLSPFIGLSAKPLQTINWHIRASYKDIYRLPTFNDLYFFNVGNVNLKPEIAQQYNIGMTWSSRISSVVEHVGISIDGYFNKVKDKIIAISPGLFVWKMKNAAKAEVKGVDVNVTSEWRLHQKIRLKLNGSYSYQSSVDLSDKESKTYKKQVTYTPKHMGSGSAAIHTPWVNISYSLVASGIRYFFPENIKRNEIPSYWDHSISANRSFPIGEHSSIQLQVDMLNLSGDNYKIIHGYPMPGRSFRASIGWHF